MKNKINPNPEDKRSKVKEISEGVYINLNRITSDEKEFEKAIEESFKELEKEEGLEHTDESLGKLDKQKPH